MRRASRSPDSFRLLHVRQGPVAILTATAMFWLMVTSAIAQEGVGLAFQDTRPLAVDWTQLNAGQEIMLCNTTEQRIKATVTATGFGFKHAKKAVPDDSVLADVEDVRIVVELRRRSPGLTVRR